jgi:serine/threonine protein kinase
VLDGDFNLKLIDFGFATKEQISNNRKGTIQYMAPEIYAKKEYRGEQADLFGCAVTLFNLVTQQTPFTTADKDDKYYSHVINGEWKKYWESQRSSDLSKSFKDLIQKMIDPEPRNRLTMDELKRHSWFTGKMLSYDEMHLRLVARKEYRLSGSSKIVGDLKQDDNTVKSSVKRYTKFFDTDDGDELVNLIIDFCRNKGYAYKKSPEFFQVEISMKSPGYNSSILANVLKKKKKDRR